MAAYAPLIKAINELKKQRNAVILAHNYMTPEIFHGVGDFLGDSLRLAKEAARTEADVIVQAGVHFMAETSKILCPDKTVLIPDLRAGCSLAASITRRGRAHAARSLSRRAGRHLRQHHRRGEGRERYLLHVVERREGGREPRRAARAADPRRVPGADVQTKTEGQDHRLEGPLRGARALHRRGHRGACAPPIRACRSSRTRSARPR